MSLPTTPTPITRIVAKHLAKGLQKKAKGDGRKLTYTQALAEVAKQCGYANVHQMTASYLDEKTVPAELADLGANPFADVLTRGKGGIVLISRDPGTGTLRRIEDHYPAGRCVQIRATMIDSYDLKHHAGLHDLLRNADAVVLDDIDRAPKHIADLLLADIADGKVAGIQLQEGATIILTTFEPAPYLAAYLKGAKKVVSLAKEPIRNFNIGEMMKFFSKQAAGNIDILSALPIDRSFSMPGTAEIPQPPNFKAYVSGSWGRLQAIVLHAHRMTKGKPIGAFTGMVKSLIESSLLDSALDPMDEGVSATVDYLMAPGTEDVLEVVNRAVDMLVEAQVPLELRLKNKMHALGDALADMSRMTGAKNDEAKRRPFADLFHPTAGELVNYFEHHAGGSPHYPLSDWTYEVTNGDTKLGYWDWLAGCYERDERSPLEPEAPETTSERLRVPGAPTVDLKMTALDPRGLVGGTLFERTKDGDVLFLDEVSGGPDQQKLMAHAAKRIFKAVDDKLQPKVPEGWSIVAAIGDDQSYDGPVRLELGEPGHNTAINYQYRDASNYKTSARAIFKGRLTPAEIIALLGKLEDGEHFIPGQVGLDDLQDSFEGCASYWDPDQDHPWHEMMEISYTDGTPSVSMTATEFLKAVQAVRWDGTYRPPFAAEMDKRYQEKLKRDAEEE